MINIKNLKITPEILSFISKIESFKGIWSGFADLKKEQLSSLRKTSTVESIGSSNRIEGNKLSDREVEKLLANIEKTSFKSRDEEEVIGYAELMNRIFEDYEIIPLTENYVKQLHSILLKHVKKDKSHRGEYKKLSNTVMAFDSDGKEIGVVFETAMPFDTPRFMGELLTWTNKNLEDKFYHPLIVVAVFVLNFLAIHPFQDGNGRLSRVLTAMLLLKAGYKYIPYSSIESIIELNKEGYYRSLRQSQKNIWENKEDYESWIVFFLTTLVKQKNHLEEKIKMIKSDDSKLSRLARNILKLFDEKEDWEIAEITEKLNANSETIRKSVKSLVNLGYLVKNGTTRGAWYEKK